jgi:hypothetical protein
MVNRSIAFFGLMIVFLGRMSAQDRFKQVLVENRYDFSLNHGRLSGAGLVVLEKAIASAQFVLIGEQHGTSQIPEFMTAVCDLAVPRGFHALAVEASPFVARQLETWARSGDARGEVAEFQKEFPDSLPFYNLQQESDLLTHCAHSVKAGNFHIWGLDQEFIGASRFLLEKLLQTHPGKQVVSEVRQMLRESDEAYKRAVASGSVKDLFLMSVPDDEMQKLRQSLLKEGNPESLAIFDAFLRSHEIYQKNLSGEYSESNHQRAVLMKEAFARFYDEASKAAGKPAKVLLKFGSVHLYKGINSLHNNDLGNFIAELAEGHGATSLHILVMGAKGAELAFVGPGQQQHVETFDLAQDKTLFEGYLEPLVSSQIDESWTLFDLRGIRKQFKPLDSLDRRLERLILGYDLLIMIPNVTASTEIR